MHPLPHQPLDGRKVLERLKGSEALQVGGAPLPYLLAHHRKVARDVDEVTAQLLAIFFRVVVEREDPALGSHLRHGAKDPLRDPHRPLNRAHSSGPELHWGWL